MYGAATRKCAAAIALLGLSMLTGCETLLSTTVRRDSGADAELLKSLRYRLGCGEIRLKVVRRRDLSEADRRASVESHEMVVRNEIIDETVIIPAGSLAKVVDVGPNWVDVKFERGQRKLRFAAPRTDAFPGHPTKIADETQNDFVVPDDHIDTYRLVAKDWERRDGEWHGEVQYGKHTYTAIGESPKACLVLDEEITQRRESTKRVVSGLDVTDDDGEQPVKTNPEPPRPPAALPAGEPSSAPAAPAPEPRGVEEQLK